VGNVGSEGDTSVLGVMGNTVTNTSPGAAGWVGTGQLSGSIGGYAQAAGIYHCPADHSKDLATGTINRVRSCSANMYVGPPSPISGNYQAFEKTTDFGRGFLVNNGSGQTVSSSASASDIFVFVDENPWSLNDGSLRVDPVNGNADCPAVNHNKSSNFSFADGHCENHHWLSAMLLADPYVANANIDVDWTWVGTHATVQDQ